METFNERNREEYDNHGGQCNKDQSGGAYWLGGFVIFIVILAILYWFGCNIGVAFVIALILAIIAGCAIYAWESYDNDCNNNNNNGKKKKNCNSGWGVFLSIIAMIIVWIIILYIVYFVVRKALVDEKCCPTPCAPKCETKCEPECPKKDC